MKRPYLVGAIVIALVFAGWALSNQGAHTKVASGTDLQAVLDASSAGDTIELAPGSFVGPLTIDSAIHLRGEGAVIAVPSSQGSAVVLTADGVTLEGLTVTGGETGISVREAEGVSLRNVSVFGSAMHGIEIVDAAAVVSGADVTVEGVYAQGIEVRNADGRPDTRIENSSFTGGQEGIVSHVSEVIVRGNTVRGTSLRGITITEMSDGVVRDNTVENAAGAGLYCGDMSRCEFTGNVVTGVSATAMGTSGAGWGLLVTYHSSASQANNVLEGAAGPVHTMLGSRIIERSPLEPGQGAGAVPYAAAALAAGLGLLLVMTRLAGSKVGPWIKRRTHLGLTWAEVGAAVLLVTLVVQSFHMVEHFLQLFRVFVDGVPSRGGLVGPRVEPEWVHLVYNALFFAGMGAIVASRAAGWGPRAPAADAVLGGAFLLQGYHAIEHVVKVIQHLVTGAKVNPGLLGEFTNLVLLHFSINAAVYLGLLFASASYLRRSISRRTSAEMIAA